MATESNPPSSEPPVLNVVGERVALGPLRADLLPLYGRWINDHRNRSASFGIMIGEPECRGRGYGTETTSLMLDYAFTGLGLHNVMLTVFAFNPGGLRAYEKSGFKTIGRRRECRAVGGEVHDEIYMDCLASEFERPATRGEGWGLCAWSTPEDTARI